MLVLKSFFYFFCTCRFKLPSVLMKSGGPLQPHKMRWEQEWVTSMKQFGRVYLNFCAVLIQHWRILGLMNVSHIMLHLFNFRLGWVVIVMVCFLSLTNNISRYKDKDLHNYLQNASTKSYMILKHNNHLMKSKSRHWETSYD